MAHRQKTAVKGEEHDCASTPGRLLGRQAIAERIDKGDIFGGDSFLDERLRGAAYDLCLAREYLITPDGRAFGPKQPCLEFVDGHLILEPGDVAFVATREKLQLGWDIAANIVPKYELARQGLFLMYGGLIDPGYGRMRNAAGEWDPRPDERLHFLIANLSSSKRVLSPGSQTIAALQFFSVEEVLEDHREEIKSAVKVWEQTAAEPLPLVRGMAFFETTTRQIEKLELGVKKVKNETTALERQIEHADKTNERVVAFGVYVLAAALMGAALTGLVAILSTEHGLIQMHFDGLGEVDPWGVATLALAVAGGIVLGACVLCIARYVGGARPRSSTPQTSN